MKTTTSLAYVIGFAFIGYWVWVFNDWPAWMVILGFYGALMLVLVVESKSRRNK